MFSEQIALLYIDSIGILTVVFDAEALLQQEKSVGSPALVDRDFLSYVPKVSVTCPELEDHFVFRRVLLVLFQEIVVNNMILNLFMNLFLLDVSGLLV